MFYSHLYRCYGWKEYNPVSVYLYYKININTNIVKSTNQGVTVSLTFDCYQLISQWKSMKINENQWKSIFHWLFNQLDVKALIFYIPFKDNIVCVHSPNQFVQFPKQFAYILSWGDNFRIRYFPEEEKNNSKCKYIFRIFIEKYSCCKYFPDTILSGSDTLFVLLDSL